MKQLLLTHAPHLAFVVVGVIAFLWTATRKPAPQAAGRAAARRSAAAPDGSRDRVPRRPRTIRRTLARRALLALGPLLAAVATGAILYGADVGGAAVPGAVVYSHTGISLLALVLVAYKLADLRRGGWRRALTGRGLASAALGAVSVPLLVTGIVLLVAPSSRSFVAYSHLIASVWWTGLLLWHLRRYLAPSLRAARRPAVARIRPDAVTVAPSAVSSPARPARARAAGPAHAPRSAPAWPAAPRPSGSTPHR